MALKDWRQTTTDGWTNDKTLQKIRIHYDNDMYVFYLYDKDWKSVMNTREAIKIKNFAWYKHSDALKFAKDYMKKY